MTSVSICACLTRVTTDEELGQLILTSLYYALQQNPSLTTNGLLVKTLFALIVDKDHQFKLKKKVRVVPNCIS